MATEAQGSTPSAKGMYLRFRQRFWRPPRAHGEIIEDRTVSFLELFYDLVYVVVIAQVSHTLAEHLTWRGVFEFFAVFGLIWIAWLNGTLYHDLHGRQDFRSRTFIFIQMGLLAWLAVYTGGAAGDDGAAFAAVYTLYLGVITWLWYVVRRQDEEQWLRVTARYLTGMVVSIVVIGGSIFLPNETRVAVWAVFVVVWGVGAVWGTFSANPELDAGITDSTVERFGLFTIIVLGEVVVGVVAGLSDAEREPITIATGLVGLAIGFGIWWTYFDFVGRRLPGKGAAARAGWMTSHFPFTMAVTASGAALISLIEHGTDSRTPAPTAWLLGGAVALALVALTLIMRSLRDFDRLGAIYRPLIPVMYLGAVVALAIGAARPRPLVLVVLLVLVLSAVWWFAVDRWLRMDDPDAAIER